jgi:hypothetical protein
MGEVLSIRTTEEFIACPSSPIPESREMLTQTGLSHNLSLQPRGDGVRLNCKGIFRLR